MNDFNNNSISPKRINQAIRALLTDLGFCTRLKGFDYMVRAIELVYLDPNKLNGIVKNVYTTIAQEFNVHPSCVERNCRTLLRVRWRMPSHREFKRLIFPRLHNGKVVPPVKEFIYSVCNLLTKMFNDGEIM